MKLWLITYALGITQHSSFCESKEEAAQNLLLIQAMGGSILNIRTIDTAADTIELSDAERKQFLKWAGV